MGRNDRFDIVIERLAKTKVRFELTETTTERSWNLDLVLAEYANKYLENFASN